MLKMCPGSGGFPIRYFESKVFSLLSTNNFWPTTRTSILHEFLAFGAMDNALMITCGEFIDHNFTHALGFSVMFSAAAGNIVADVCGVGKRFCLAVFESHQMYVKGP